MAGGRSRARPLSGGTTLWTPYGPRAHFLSILYLVAFTLALNGEVEFIHAKCPPGRDPKRPRFQLEKDADVCASSANAPPSPSELFARLGMMLVVALAFGLSAQVLVGNLPH